MFEVGKTYTIITWEGSEDGGIPTEHPVKSGRCWINGLGLR